MPILEFTVALPALLKEGGMLLLDHRYNAAGMGLLDGYQIALYNLVEIGKEAERICNIPILLRLFAIGVVENPVPILKGDGKWDEQYTALAERLGAGG